MSAATADPAERLVEGLARIDRSARRARPLLGAALLVAALSLIAATVLTVQSIDLANRLEIKTKQLESTQQRLVRVLAERTAIAASLHRANDVLADNKASPAERQAARETSREVSQVLPTTSGGAFAMPAASPLDRVQLLTYGAATGWDVDILWCADRGAAQSYANGRAAAVALAGAAGASQAIAPGVRLGRIRLRPIQPGDTAVWRGAMGGRSLLVVTDSGPGEAEAARAVLAQLPARDGAAAVDQATLPGRQAPSRWYLSVVACSAE